MKKILVVGSINMDLLVSTDEIPGPGETVMGNDFSQIPGGKGANQAVAMAKLRSDVTFLGKIGRDPFGETLVTSMKNAGVNTSYIEEDGETTGIAVINVDKDGNNNIVVIAGSNWKVDNEYLERNKKAFKEADLVVFQLEVPIETVKTGLKIAKDLGKTTILNPAPARELDDEIIKNIDIFIPNEHELARLAGMEVKDKNSMLEAGKILISKGIKEIIVTLGRQGVLYINSENHKFIDSYKVKVVDTTAAGDSFIGGFTSSYIEDGNIEKAIDLGQRTAALSIQKLGAQSSIPSREEVNNFKAQ